MTAISLSSRLDRLRAGDHVILSPAGPGGGEAGYVVEDSWVHQGRLILKFQGVDSIGDAERLRGAEVLLERRDTPVEEAGEPDLLDLNGFDVVDHASGGNLGVVTGWVATGGPPLLQVTTPEGHEVLVPYVPAICMETDWQAKRVVVDPPDGLMDLNRE